MALCEAVKLTRHFGGVLALQEITLSLESATIVAIIGPNGSGKTTLFNLLAGQIRPTAGTVFWRGRDITTWPPHRRCLAGINRTFQVARPFLDLSLTENVAVGVLYGTPGAAVRRRPDALEQARALLEGVGLEARAAAPARTLSLGELKRLELAMAQSTRPDLLLVDEALAGQSPSSAQDILRHLTRLRSRGVTICLVEHRLKALLAVA
ncbi:MAG TPA: ATP-binding cassette domain-containing protein, partial [Candidatus Methylomirabilis sp.]|nr:ATP-binding cassette domain-containing protein [Candidatus Methylomirabilis sp.]